MAHKTNCTPEEEKMLLAKGVEAKAFAYCPYSGFPVGVALLTKQGQVFTGCNVENAAYSVATCAERTAVCKAVSEGYRDFKAVVITSNMVDSFISPCGNCRQTLAEFNLDMTVYMTKPDGSFQTFVLSDLLPFAFTPARMAEKRLEQEPKDKSH